MGSKKRTEALIKSALQYGTKQQTELIELVDRSESTVRKHLKDLVEEGDIQKTEDGREVFYYIDKHRKDTIEPKPSANQGKIGVLLDTIAQEMGVSLTDSKSEYSEGLKNIRSEIYNEVEKDSIPAVVEFNKECSQKYHVLSNDENLRKAVEILDQLINIFDRTEADRGSLPLPDEVYSIYFHSLESLQDNWSKGVENEYFYSEISNRTEKIVGNAPQMPRSCVTSLSILVLAQDKNKAEEMFRRMVRHGEQSVETWREVSVLTFDLQNNIDKLFNLLEKIENSSDDARREKIQQLSENVRDDYQ